MTYDYADLAEITGYHFYSVIPVIRVLDHINPLIIYISGQISDFGF